jgi:FkbM family methyltransferase
MIIDIDSDRFVREVIEGNEYSFLFNDLVVVDLGCNVGTFSFWIHKLAREIHAVDMVPENINNMNETIKKNGLDKIKTYCIAITGSNMQRKYSKDPVLGGGGSQIDKQGTLVTDCTTLKQFMAAHKIDYIDVLKMDIEKMEQEVLAADDFPQENIYTIIGEIHKDKHRRRIEVKHTLEKMGYRYTEPRRNHFLARKI